MYFIISSKNIAWKWQLKWSTVSSLSSPFRVRDWFQKSSNSWHGSDPDEGSVKNHHEWIPRWAIPWVSDMPQYFGFALILKWKDHEGQADSGPGSRENILEWGGTFVWLSLCRAEMQLSFTVVRLLYLYWIITNFTINWSRRHCVHTKCKLKLSKLKIHQRCRFFSFTWGLFEDLYPQSSWNFERFCNKKKSAHQYDKPIGDLFGVKTYCT